VTCKHQKLRRIPSFPGDALVCQCGYEMPKAGYDEHGRRMYYLPGDHPMRMHSEAVKVQWLTNPNVEVTQCPVCCFVGTDDDFDCMGGDDGELFCNQCGAAFQDACGAASNPQSAERRLFT
jgi:hypothetical protein